MVVRYFRVIYIIRRYVVDREVCLQSLLIAMVQVSFYEVNLGVFTIGCHRLNRLQHS